MKHLYAGRINIAALFAAASCLLASSPGPSLAQRGSPGATAAGRRVETLNRQGEQYERDSLSRDRAPAAGATGDRRSAQALADQVRHDFEGLQAGYNKIVLAMPHGGQPDYGSISEAVAEVKRCATRLKHNLALPRPKDDRGQKAHSGVRAAPPEESLLALRKHIYSFVTNPTFEARAGLDVEQAARAGRDLEMILELSERLRKGVGSVKGRPD